MDIQKIRSYRFEVSVLVPEFVDLGFVVETLILKIWQLSDMIGQEDKSLQMELSMYSFSENSGGKLPKQEALIF